MDEIFELNERSDYDQPETLAKRSITDSSDLNDITNIISRAVEANAIPKSQGAILWSKIRSCVSICGIALLISIAITIGVLVVYFTSPKPGIAMCPLIYKSIISNSIEYHSHPRSAAIGDFNNDHILDIAVANFAADNIGIFIGLGQGEFLNQKIYSTGSGSSPCSIALSDFNNDTYLDIVVVTYGTHSIHIFLGNGNGTLTFKIQYSTNSSRPFFVTIADLNHDQQLDIILANYGTDNIAIRFGQGDGTFLNQIIYSTGYDSLPYSIAIADLNNDIQQDIIVANYGTNNIGILFGSNNSTFTNPMIYSTGLGSHPSSVAIGDFNKDNRLDIAVANQGTQSIGVVLGYGNKTFSKVILFSTSDFIPQHISISDMNNDYYLDIVVANTMNNTICTLLGYGNGSFTLGTIYFTGFGSNPSSVAIGDFNNDHRFDVVVTNNGTNKIGILIGYDPAAFTNQMTYETGFASYPAAVAVGDFDNDNRSDIVIVNSRTSNMAIRLGYGDGTFSNQITYSTGRDAYTFAVAIGDFNNDHNMDVAVANMIAFSVGIFLGYGNGTFQNQTTYSTGDSSRPFSIAVGDFNNDHRLDIVVANSDNANIGIFIGYGNGTFANQTTYSTGSDSRPLSVAVADLNNDYFMDIVVAHYYDDNIGVFLGYGNGSFADQVTYSTEAGIGLQSVVIEDFNHDHQLDIICADSNLNVIDLFFGYGNGSFASVLKYSFQPDYFPYQIKVGDFNNDHHLDIVVVNKNSATFGILLGDGNQIFLKQKTYSTGDLSSPNALAIADFNNDNRLDVVIANIDSDNVGIFLGYDSAAFRNQILYSTGAASHPISVAVGDFNRDHYLDIVLANYGTETISILFQNTVGTFENETYYRTGDNSLPYSVTVADCNNDNYLDIIVVQFGSHSIGVFLGYGNGSFAIEKIYSTGPDSFPSSIATGDFNNDHWLDIVVADSGTNNISLFLGYKYATFIDQMRYDTEAYAYPSSIAVGDFNHDNQIDIVATLYYKDQIFLLLGSNDGTFVKHGTYSTGDRSRPKSVAVGYINSDNKLDIVTANEQGGTIAIFLGDGTGNFTDAIIYSTGEYSAPSSVVIGDFNHDNQSDIVVADARGDKILIYLGYGNGSFMGYPTYSIDDFSYPSSIAIGDFNKDTHLDLVVAKFIYGELDIFFGYGNGSFADLIPYSTGIDSYPIFVVVRDLNKDDQLDIVVANSLSNTIGVFLGVDNGSFAIPIMYATDFLISPSSITIDDLNNDNHLDIVVTYPADYIAIYLGFGDGTFGMITTLYTGYNSEPQSVAIAYFNNDNLLDIAVANKVGDNIGIFLGYCCEPYVSQTMFSTGNNSRPRSVVVGDLNLDNRSDIFVINEGSNNIGVLLGYGNGTFLEQIILSIDSNSHPYSMAIADFNHDNWLDIALANYANESVGIMLGIDNITFSNQIIYSIGLSSRPNALVIGDFNNDTKLDIAVSNDGTNGISILYGYGNGSFSLQTSFSTGYNSQPCSLAIGDLNNDTISDIVVTNCEANNIGIISKFC